MTRRMAGAVIQACERLPSLHVAQLFGLHWDTVRLLERRALQAALSVLPKAQPRRLVMDEFALFKGHRYASVVLDADTRRVLWIGEGRSRAAVRPFFRSDEHTSELQSLMRISYAVFCLTKKTPRMHQYSA